MLHCYLVCFAGVGLGGLYIIRKRNPPKSALQFASLSQRTHFIIAFSFFGNILPHFSSGIGFHSAQERASGLNFDSGAPRSRRSISCSPWVECCYLWRRRLRACDGWSSHEDLSPPFLRDHLPPSPGNGGWKGRKEDRTTKKKEQRSAFLMINPLRPLI